MEYFNRSALPVFSPRLDLTAEELNQQAETITKAINELAGRLEIIRSEIKEEDRRDYSKEISFPILNTIAQIKAELNSLTLRLEEYKQEASTLVDQLTAYHNDLEIRLNALDDAAARKEDLAVLLNRED